ncbi:septum site-determining protein MinC [Vallitalea sp.]|jgi:septum site-determining protein MinC|uniref:septum site-determining protein MinC n=1 Tax=Vallitalea sp. TaxID=1882829 RepID=UPI0025F995BF|nr:septum site-determining protein MinC [Vallitalea sp.]MCT4688915.1 septum site-determining protein MinC [Vallitalea sp.]
MSDCILIKGNKYGLTIILDENVTFKILKQTLRNKIIDAKKFFKNAKVAITFTGRDLSDKEQKELVDIITTFSDMKVTCIMDETNSSNNDVATKKDEVDKNDILGMSNPMGNTMGDPMAVFHKGTLRSGQQLNVDHSVIIMGDVNPGAKITARGNVIVLGALKGTVYVKELDGKHPFVVALSMKPMQLKIGDIMGRSPDDKELTIDTTSAQIAYVVDGRICMETLNNNIYKELEYYDHEETKK